MENKKENDFGLLIAQRLDKIRIQLGLEVKGLAKMIDRSPSHVYSLISGRRSLPENLAKIIASYAGITSDQIYNLNNSLAGPLGDTSLMDAFRKEHRLNRDYFIETREERNSTFWIKTYLLEEGFFHSPKRAADVVSELQQSGREESSEKVTKSLTYLVKVDLLQSKKVPILLASGEKGRRKINVYWQEE